MSKHGTTKTDQGRMSQLRSKAPTGSSAANQRYGAAGGQRGAAPKPLANNHTFPGRRK